MLTVNSHAPSLGQLATTPNPATPPDILGANLFAPIVGTPPREGTVPVRFGELVLHMTPLAAKCTYNDMTRSKQLRDLTGQRFGRLVVIERMLKNTEGKWLWLCRCDCGTECLRVGYNVSSSGTQSCGCLRNEVSLANLRKGCESFSKSGKKKARKAAA